MTRHFIAYLSQRWLLLKDLRVAGFILNFRTVLILFSYITLFKCNSWNHNPHLICPVMFCKKWVFLFLSLTKQLAGSEARYLLDKPAGQCKNHGRSTRRCLDLLYIHVRLNLQWSSENRLRLPEQESALIWSASGRTFFPHLFRSFALYPQGGIALLVLSRFLPKFSL